MNQNEHAEIYGEPEKKYQYKLIRVCPVCNYCWTEITEGMPDLWSKQDCPMNASIACGGKVAAYCAEQIDP